eukprot:CAMPEP_0169262138 /NCGR_PEP_ID=MMETSP1016-20121227/43526_1 /TAXON_ID=342587 /ORGANISM="Karlodinium micrum, Strain CCMP2283" /LENGTH=115 /DNA_ID=CAMNT_0009344601 /DNA_START=869 /DNA_END=1216 /DNA_ORIENTATION=-
MKLLDIANVTRRTGISSQSTLAGVAEYRVPTAKLRLSSECAMSSNNGSSTLATVELFAGDKLADNRALTTAATLCIFSTMTWCRLALGLPGDIALLAGEEGDTSLADFADDEAGD